MSDKKPWELPEYETVIDKLKHRQVWGNSRPELIGKIDPDNKTPPNLSLHWLCAAQGDIWLRDPSSQNEKDILKYLIALGMAVPTSVENHYGIGDMQHYNHFDDVNWGLNSEGQVIIYRLSQNPHYPDAPDEIIQTDERHRKAIDHLKHLIKMGSAIEDDTITLKSREVITPIITGSGMVAYRQRQKGIFPNQLETGLRPEPKF